MSIEQPLGAKPSELYKESYKPSEEEKALYRKEEEVRLEKIEEAFRSAETSKLASLLPVLETKLEEISRQLEECNEDLVTHPDDLSLKIELEDIKGAYCPYRSCPRITA